MQLSVGTNEVERYARMMCKQSMRSVRNKKLIRNTMKYKVEDAEYDWMCAKRKFVENTME